MLSPELELNITGKHRSVGGYRFMLGFVIEHGDFASRKRAPWQGLHERLTPGIACSIEELFIYGDLSISTDVLW